MKNNILTFIKMLISILRIIKNTRVSLPLPTKQNNEVVLIGNGPSFNLFLQNHIDFLVDKDCICVNEFANSGYYEQIRPINYIIIDPAYFEKNPDSTLRERIQCLEDNLNTKTDWNMTLFFPMVCQNHKKYRVFNINNKKINIYYYNNTIINGFKFFKNMVYKYNLGAPAAQNVLVAGGYVAIRLSYNNIYLVGADHSWHTEIKVDEENRLLLKDKHFYNYEPTYSPWQKNLVTHELWKVHEIFFALGKMFEGYHELKEFGNSMGSNFYNLTQDSFIDAFQKIELEERN